MNNDKCYSCRETCKNHKVCMGYEPQPEDCRRTCRTPRAACSDNCKRIRVYISGPISGDEDWYEKFTKAEGLMQREGHQPLNPAIWYREGVDLTYDEYMKLDLAMLQIADVILLLPGWEKSAGAKKELEEAQKLGLDIWMREIK